MNTKLSKTDRRFLKSDGIAAEPAVEETHSALAEDRLALAKRIAKHQAPGQVKIDPDAARLALIRMALTRLLEASEDHEY